MVGVIIPYLFLFFFFKEIFSSILNIAFSFFFDDEFEFTRFLF